MTDVPIGALQKGSEHGSGHVTVLLSEAVEALNLVGPGVVVDGTFGGGGHTLQILETAPNVSVLAIDADPAAADRADAIRAEVGPPDRLVLVHRNFRELADIVRERGLTNVTGILLDLGLSSFQLDQGERGFSFRFDAPLDMRFDTSRGETAADILNGMDEVELARLLWEYGDERKSRQIASAVVRQRLQRPITTTAELATLVERAVGGRRNAPIHPATRTFQALRIAVNDELQALREVLEGALEVLGPGGRLVVIAFHSLEDRIVKRFIEDAARTCVCPPEQPVCTCDTIPRLVRVGKSMRPTDAEQRANPRSRSAIMRIAERLAADGRPVSQGVTQ